jgi:hypothetical protein
VSQWWVEDCASDVETLVAKYPQLEGGRGPNMLRVFQAFITDESKQGLGIGKAMYQALMAEWFDRNGPFLFMPMQCSGSGTSSMAKRVWASLGRRYPSSGDVVAVLKRPQLPAELKMATKSEGEKEDEEAERLVRKDPKYKPPRSDLRRRRVRDDEDEDPDEKQDKKDRSQNYKDSSRRAVLRVAYRHLVSRAGPDLVNVRLKTGPNKGQIVQVNKDWKSGPDRAKYEEVQPGEEDAPAAKGKGKKKDEPEQSETEKAGVPPAIAKKYPDLDLDLLHKIIGKMKPTSTDDDLYKVFEEFATDPDSDFGDWTAAVSPKELGAMIDALNPQRTEYAEATKQIQRLTNIVKKFRVNPGFAKALGKLKKREDQLAAMEAYLATQEGMAKVDPNTPKAQRDGRKALGVDEDDLFKMKGAELGAALARAEFAHKRVFNPMAVGGDVSTDRNRATQEEITELGPKLKKRAEASYRHYQALSKTERDSAASHLSRSMKNLPADSPRAMEIEAIWQGIVMAAVMDGDTPPRLSGGPKVTVSKQFTQLARAMSTDGREALLLGSVSDFTTPEARGAVRTALETMTTKELAEFIGKDHPMYSMLQAAQERYPPGVDEFGRPVGGDFIMGDQARREMRQYVMDAITDNIGVLDAIAGAHLEASGKENTAEARAAVLEEVDGDLDIASELASAGATEVRPGSPTPTPAAPAGGGAVETSQELVERLQAPGEGTPAPTAETGEGAEEEAPSQAVQAARMTRLEAVQNHMAENYTAPEEPTREMIQVRTAIMERSPAALEQPNTMPVPREPEVEDLPDDAIEPLEDDEGRENGEHWESKGVWYALDPKGERGGPYKSEEAAKDWAKGKAREKKERKKKRKRKQQQKSRRKNRPKKKATIEWDFTPWRPFRPGAL